ncbi:MAG: beta-galactosidase [Phycisphaerae bacterium]
MRCDWFSGKRAMIAWVMFICVAAVAAEHAGSPYGICAHVSRWSDHNLAKEEFALMREAGIRYARTDFDWTTLQQADGGEWQFEMFDSTVQMAEDAGITILPILAYDVDWARPAYKHLDKWLGYVRAVVSRYKDRLPYWEIWNEEDLEGFWRETPDPANYTTLLKATYSEIKDINPELTVVLGGLSGIPFEYLEGIYKAGGGDFFDVLAVHPYRYPGSPEANNLEADMLKLKDMMAEYGDEAKPIWFTEIGWPTHKPQTDLLADIVRAGLEAAAPDRAIWIIAVFDDPGYPTQASFSDEQIKQMLPGSGKITRLTLADFGNLTASKYHALIWPPEEAFAEQLFGKIERFVRDGGIVIFTSGVPLYYAASQNPDGSWARSGADESHRRRLRIGWEAWWTKEGVPEEAAELTAAEAFAGKIDLTNTSAKAARFLTDSAIREGDEFVPLLLAKKGDFTGVAAALYKLGGEMKGAVIVSALMQDCRGVSERRQAAMLARSYIIALQCGAEKMFWYNLRAGEWDPFYNEANFGIVHKDLTPKPAYTAMQALNKARPAGSVGSGLASDGTLYYPSWTDANGRRVYAVWTASTETKAEFEIDGQIESAFDMFGNKAPLKIENGSLPVTVSSEPIYIIGPRSLKLKR